MTKRNLLTIFVAVFFVGSITLFNSCSKEQEKEVTPEKFDVPTQMPDIDKIQTTSEFSDKLGCKLLTKEEYAKIPLADDVPAAKASYKFLSTPDVGDQGSDGSCVGWGTAYSARSVMTNGNTYFSPAYVYNQIKISNCASGSYITDALDLIEDEGVCTWSYMPYVEGDCYTQPNSTQRVNASNYEISRYRRVSINTNSIRNQIASGRAVVVGGRVDYYFQTLGYNYILNYVSGSGGGHCYTVVGYYDDYDCFLVQNSWGTSWATDGFGWVSYDIVSQLWSEAYVML